MAQVDNIIDIHELPTVTDVLDIDTVEIQIEEFSDAEPSSSLVDIESVEEITPDC